MAASKSFAKPYARALFELAATEADRKVWQDRLEVLDRVFHDPLIARSIARVSVDESVGWLKSAMGDRVDGPTYALLSMLIENGHLAGLGDIAATFAALVREAQGTGILNVTTAVTLNVKEQTDALMMFEKLFKQKLIPQYQVDPSIQGGMVGQVNDLVYDGSLKGSLEILRENLFR